MFELGISTSTKPGSISLFKKGKLVDSVHWKRDRSHSELVTKSLEDLLARNQIELSQLSSLLVDQGPGSFTGIRVSATLFKTLAYTCGISIMPFHSLDLIAQDFFAKHPGTNAPVYPIINAFKNMIFVGKYIKGSDGFERVHAPSSIPVSLAADHFDEGSKVIGSGYSDYEGHLHLKSQTEYISGFDFPNSETLGPLSMHKSLHLPTMVWKDFSPLYIRNSEAEEKLEAGLLKPIRRL